MSIGKTSPEESLQSVSQLGSIEAPLIRSYEVEVDYATAGIRQFVGGRSEVVPPSIGGLIKQQVIPTMENFQPTPTDNRERAA